MSFWLMLGGTACLIGFTVAWALTGNHYFGAAAVASGGITAMAVGRRNTHD
jgi:uncharacterized membrane protein